jgi:hypothetical protein
MDSGGSGWRGGGMGAHIRVLSQSGDGGLTTAGYQLETLAKRSPDFSSTKHFE